MDDVCQIKMLFVWIEFDLGYDYSVMLRYLATQAP